MNMTGRELHAFLKTKIQGFEDIDLYHNMDTLFQVDTDFIEEQIEKGYLSINNTEGMKVYYCEI
ncbi:MAG: hypothetical protein ACYSTS_19515 [Planctomycetota bacterium]|jgi:hypothetical protein